MRAPPVTPLQEQTNKLLAIVSGEHISQGERVGVTGQAGEFSVADKTTHGVQSDRISRGRLLDRNKHSRGGFGRSAPLETASRGFNSRGGVVVLPPGGFWSLTKRTSMSGGIGEWREDATRIILSCMR